MAFLKTDVYGNKSAGADYAPLSVKFDELTPAQQAARVEFLQQSGYWPGPSHILESSDPRAFFTAENVDAYHDLFGGPKPQHGGPGSTGDTAATAYKVFSTISKAQTAAMAKATPLAAVGLGIANELARSQGKFRGENIIKLIDYALPAVQGIGAGYLGLMSGGYIGSQPITRNPLASALVTGGGSVVSRILASR